MRRIVVGITAALFFMSLGPAALAEERVCRGTIGGRTVDNLRVPQDATCTLNGTFVKGTIKIERAATLRAHGVRVIGNVQAENSRNVVVNEGSRIGGSVQIVQGGAARIVGNRITGDILFDEQDRLLVANRNRVGGNLQAFQNNGGVRINNNRIDGNLQCKENVPAPTGGGTRWAATRKTSARVCKHVSSPESTGPDSRCRSRVLNRGLAKCIQLTPLYKGVGEGSGYLVSGLPITRGSRALRH